MTRPRTADLAAAGVTLDNWMRSPGNALAFQRVRDLVPSERATADPARTWPLEPADPVLAAACVGARFPGIHGSPVGLTELLDQTDTDALVVLHRGRLVHEEHRHGMAPDVPHLCMSVSKSITGTVVGQLVGTGHLDPGHPVTDLAPELADTGLAGATVRHLLDMRTGTHEDITSLELQRAYYAAIGWAPPAPGMAAHRHSRTHFARFRQVRPHGTDFEYRSTLTCVLAMLCERATGRSFPDLLSGLWQAIGAESDCEITVDGAGHAIADIGVSCTARDLARLGEVLRRDGRGPHGTPVLTPEWVADTVTDREELRLAFEAHGGVFLPGPRAFYRNQWWIGHGRAGADGACYYAIGIHGQLLYVDEEHELVVAKFSSWPEPWVEEAALATLRACEALAAALSSAVSG